MVGLVPLEEDSRGLFFLFLFAFAMWGHTKKPAICKPRRAASAEPGHASKLILDLQAPEPWQIHVYSSCSICGVLSPPKLTMTRFEDFEDWSLGNKTFPWEASLGPEISSRRGHARSPWVLLHFPLPSTACRLRTTGRHFKAVSPVLTTFSPAGTCITVQTQGTVSPRSKRSWSSYKEEDFETFFYLMQKGKDVDKYMDIPSLWCLIFSIYKYPYNNISSFIYIFRIMMI